MTEKHRRDVDALVDECLRLVRELRSSASTVAEGRFLRDLEIALLKLKAASGSGGDAFDAGTIATWIGVLLEAVKWIFEINK